MELVREEVPRQVPIPVQIKLKIHQQLLLLQALRLALLIILQAHAVTYLDAPGDQCPGNHYQNHYNLFYKQGLQWKPG